MYALGSCTISSRSPTYSFASATDEYLRCTMSGSATFSAMVISGLNELPGSWNTNPMSARLGLKSRSLTPSISTPSTLSEPPLTFCRPAIARPVVDFPEPDSPTRPSTSER